MCRPDVGVSVYLSVSRLGVRVRLGIRVRVRVRSRVRVRVRFRVGGALAHLLYEEQPARHRHVDGKVLARVQPLAEALHLDGRVGRVRGGG